MKWTNPHTQKEDKFDACALNADNVTPQLLARFTSGQGDLWTTSPEMLQCNQKVRSAFIDMKWRARCGAAFLDEAHTMPEWGRSFRPGILELSLVKQLMGSEMTWIMLSATLTTSAMMYLIDNLGLKGLPLDVTDMGVDREELFYDIQAFHRGHSDFSDLGVIVPLSLLPIIPQPPNSINQFTSFANSAPASLIPQTVVFLSRKSDCTNAAFHFRQLIPPHLHSAITVFSGGCTAVQRQEILNRMKSGVLRVVFATEAFGLGCDVSGIELVVQYGDPQSLVTLMQHQGRGGRGINSKAAKSIWFTSPDTFGPLPSSAPSKPLHNATYFRSETLPTVIAPLTPLDTSLNPQLELPQLEWELSTPPQILPLYSQIPSTSNLKAMNHRTSLQQRDLYRLSNPRNHECSRLVREQILLS